MKDTKVHVDGKDYNLLGIDESGEHPIFDVSPCDSDDEEYQRIDSDMNSLLAVIIASMQHIDLEKLEVFYNLQEICYALYIDYEDAVNAIGEENIIKEIPKEEDYQIDTVQLMKLLRLSDFATAGKLYDFLIETSAELREGIQNSKAE